MIGGLDGVEGGDGTMIGGLGEIDGEGGETPGDGGVDGGDGTIDGEGGEPPGDGVVGGDGTVDGEGGEPPGDGVVGGDGTTTGGRVERPHPNEPQSTGGREEKAAHCTGDLCAGLDGKQFRRSSNPGKPRHTGGSPVKKL